MVADDDPPPSSSSPVQFVNSPGLDFGSVEDAKPEQELDIIQKKECVEYGVR